MTESSMNHLITIHPSWHDWQLHGKRVLIRVDLNLPENFGDNPLRFTKILNTLEYIQQGGAQPIIISHYGRPDPHNDDDKKKFSLRYLIPLFAKYDFDVAFISKISQIKALPFNAQQLILSENIRFFPEEYLESRDFADELATLADYFVQDAFGALAHHATSITQLPLSFSIEKRSIGLLITQEIRMLNSFFSYPKQERAIILGGNKHEKLDYIIPLLKFVDAIFLLPAIVFTLTKALGHTIGISSYDQAAQQSITRMLSLAAKEGVSLFLPEDFIIQNHNGQLVETKGIKIDNGALGVTIGPKSLAIYCKNIIKYKALFLNGLAGFEDQSESMIPWKTIATLAQQQELCIIGGGNTVDYLQNNNLIEKKTFLSTGGKATLAYLAHQSLPGLYPFL